MGFMSNFTGRYANFEKKSEQGMPMSAPTSSDLPEIKRVTRDNLENTYLTDSQTFNTINKIKQLIMQAGFLIKSDKKQTQSKYDEFFDGIGTIGLKMDVNQILDSLIHDLCLYGASYVERIYNQAGSRIVDLKMIDPKLMNYAKDAENQIITDSEQNPIGYTMFVGYSSNAVGDTIPEGVNVETDEIFLLTKRIAHFKLFSFGNRFESIGIVEPAYLDIQRKHKIETAAANSIHNTAAYPLIGYVGSDTKHANKKQMDSTLNALQNLQHSRYMVFEHPTNIQALEVKHSDQIDQVLRYLRTNQSAASGMALGFSVGTGEAVNRSTLSTQQTMLDLSLESMASTISSQFNRLVLDSLKEVNGYDSNAKLVFGNVAAEEKNEKTKRLLDSISQGVLAPEEVREYVLFAEGIEANDSAYKKLLDTPKTDKIPKEEQPLQEVEETKDDEDQTK